MVGYSFLLSLFLILLIFAFVTVGNKAENGQLQQQYSSDRKLKNYRAQQKIQKLPAQPQPIFLINGQNGEAGSSNGGGRRTPPNPRPAPSNNQPAAVLAPAPGMNVEQQQNLQAFLIGQLQNGLNPAQAFVLTTQHIAGPLMAQHLDQTVGLSARMQAIGQNSNELLQRHFLSPIRMPVPVRGDLFQNVIREGYQATLNRAMANRAAGQQQQPYGQLLLQPEHILGNPLRRLPQNVPMVGVNQPQVPLFTEVFRSNVDVRQSAFHHRRGNDHVEVIGDDDQAAVATSRNHAAMARWIRAHRQRQRAQGRGTPLLGWQAPPRYRQPQLAPLAAGPSTRGLALPLPPQTYRPPTYAPGTSVPGTSSASLSTMNRNQLLQTIAQLATGIQIPPAIGQRQQQGPSTSRRRPAQQPAAAAMFDPNLPGTSGSRGGASPPQKRGRFYQGGQQQPQQPQQPYVTPVNLLPVPRQNQLIQAYMGGDAELRAAIDYWRTFDGSTHHKQAKMPSHLQNALSDAIRDLSRLGLVSKSQISSNFGVSRHLLEDIGGLPRLRGQHAGHYMNELSDADMQRHLDRVQRINHLRRSPRPPIARRHSNSPTTSSRRRQGSRQNSRNGSLSPSRKPTKPYNFGRGGNLAGRRRKRRAITSGKGGKGLMELYIGIQIVKRKI